MSAKTTTTTPDPVKARPTENSVWKLPLIPAYAAAAVLGLASLLKLLDGYQRPGQDNQALHLALACAELCLAATLLLWPAHRSVRAGTAALFMVFAAYAGFRLSQGEADCGCLGALTLHPGVTLALDLTLAGLLVYSLRQPSPPTERDPPHDGARARLKTLALLATVATTGLGGIWLLNRRPSTLNAGGIVQGDGDTILLEPAKWVGGPLPLLPYLEQAAHLKRGDWRLLLVQPGCETCLETVADLSVSASTRSVVICTSTPDSRLLEAAGTTTVYTLPANRQWHAQTPLTIRMRDGIVTGVTATGHPRGGSLATASPGSVPFNDDGVAELGYLKPGSAHTLRYRITAPPGQALEDIQIVTGCPCTTVTQQPKRLGPGQSGTIQLRFEAPHRVLHYRHALLINAKRNNGEQNTRLMIDAMIGLPLEVSPTRLAPDQLEANPAIVVTNHGDESVQLIYALSDNPAYRIAIPKGKIEPGSSLTLTIARATQAGPSEATIRIKTTLNEQPELVVTLHGDGRR